MASKMVKTQQSIMLLIKLFNEGMWCKCVELSIDADFTWACLLVLNSLVYCSKTLLGSIKPNCKRTELVVISHHRTKPTPGSLYSQEHHLFNQVLLFTNVLVFYNGKESVNNTCRLPRAPGDGEHWIRGAG